MRPTHEQVMKRDGRRHLPVLCDFPGCYRLAFKSVGMCRTHYVTINRQHRFATEPEFRTRQRATNMKWKKRHPEKTAFDIVKFHRVTRWAKYLAERSAVAAELKGIPCDLDEAFVLSLFEKQGGLCYWLGIPMVPSVEKRGISRPSLDRLVPEFGYVRGNVVLATQFANMGRNACSAENFAEFVKVLREKLPR